MASFLRTLDLRKMVEVHGITFIGPSPAHIRMMGDKIAAKAAMASLCVPLVNAGSDGGVPDLGEPHKRSLIRSVTP